MTDNTLDTHHSHSGGQYHSTNTSASKQQKIEVNPKLPGFFTAYVLFGLPGFLTSLVWLVITFILLIAVIAGVAGPSDPARLPLDYSVVQSSNLTKDSILIYDMSGVIDTGTSSLADYNRLDGIYTEIVRRDFARIKEDSSIKNVVFRVNTPGGSVFASRVLGDLITDLIKSKGQDQAVFYFDQVAASGGLWATYKTNNYVVGSPYGETGSIGVILELPNYQGLAEKVGYSQTVIKSSQSKDIGNPLRELDPNEKAFLQKQVDETYNEFIDVVAKGRKQDKAKIEQIANGYVYDNETALGYGLLDELGQVDTAIRKAASNAGVNDYNVVEVKTESSFASLFSIGNIPALKSLNKAADTLNPSSTLKPGTVYALDPLKVQ